jgi:hypothetical protein
MNDLVYPSKLVGIVPTGRIKMSGEANRPRRAVAPTAVSQEQNDAR